MEPLSATASIIATLQLTSKVLGYLNEVKDASKDRERCAIEISNLYGILLSLRCRLEEGAADSSWHTAVRALTIENGPLDQFTQALELLQAKMTHGGVLKKAGEVLSWKFKKEEIANIFDRVERLKSLVQIALQMDHFKLAEATKDDTVFIREHIPVIQSGLETIQLDQDNAKHKRLIEWLSPLDFPTQQSDIISRKQDGTGQWFLDHPTFANWLRDPSETLFCPGIPGAGKTMIAAITIDYLLKTVRSSTTGVAYVYCNYKAQEEQSASNLLAAILKQLLYARPSISGPVELIYERHADRGTRPSVDDISHSIQEVLVKFSSAHIVVDALDECREDNCTRRQFLDQIQVLRAKNKNLHLMVTSRYIPEIVEKFKSARKLEVRASDDDVRRFVAGQFYRLPRCIQRDVELQTEVQEKVVEAVDGMFLLARLHIDSLLDKRTKSKVEAMLKTLFGGFQALDKAYDYAIERINGQLPGDTALAKRVLSWITNAKRPLTTTEICYALAVEPNTDELDFDNIPDIDDLVSVCAGLVAVDEESKIVRLVHYTTQEYFERIQEDWNPGVQLDIASTCLTCLTYTAFRKGTHDYYLYRHWIGQNPFLVYAARHWGQHARTVQKELYELAHSFLRYETLLSCARHFSATEDYLVGRTGLHITAQFGLQVLLENLLSGIGEHETASIDARDSQDRTPLSLAVEYGHECVVKLLLVKGADINAECENYGTALQAAAFNGHEGLVRLLLNSGANVNANGRKFGTALHAASRNGHKHIIHLLLEYGAKINPESAKYVHGSALHAAAWDGHVEVAKLLLSKGADLHAHNEQCGSALQIAAWGGHESLVSFLLKEGADMYTTSGLWGNALQSASAGGDERIVNLLLNAGADVNAQSGGLSSALQAASFCGNTHIVDLLLRNGANINAEGGDLGSPLQAASLGGFERIVQLLLDNGVDINAKGGEYSSSLQAASFRGHKSVVKLLVDRGADVNAQGGKYGNALQAAAYRGRESIVNLLIDSGADINMQGGFYGNALQGASYRGHERIVELLVDRGADINAQGGYYGSALQGASYRGHVLIVKFLLDKGADVNAICLQHGSFLHLLAYMGFTDLLRSAYLEYRANMNLKDPYGRTPLQLAARGGQFETFVCLMDLGADYMTLDAKGDSLLSYASSGDSLPILNVVLEKGLIHSPHNLGWSPLHWACREGNAEIVERLLREGLSSECVTIPQQEGQWSPVSIATFHGNENMLLQLSTASRLLIETKLDHFLVGEKHLKFVCDGCFHRIYGPRFKCRTCLDFDFCFMCMPFLSPLHENHEWDRIEPDI